MRKCEKCKNHNLLASDCVHENLSLNAADSESEHSEATFLCWSKDDGTAKVDITLDVEDDLLAWQEAIVKITEHIFTK